MYALNTDEIQALCPTAKIILYPDLKKYHSLDDLLGKYGQAILLYLTIGNFGHYCCVFKRDNGEIEFFDSMGGRVDGVLKNVDPDFKELSDQKARLTKFLLDHGCKKVIYNEHDVQGKSNTCGRWCGLRLLFNHMTLDEFIKTFGNLAQAQNDNRVTRLTNGLF